MKPKPTRDIPGSVGIFAAGSIIGVFSSLVGIGGGTLSVPFLTWCNTKIHKAIGTSSAIGFPIAAAGFLGYVINGLGTPNLPPLSLGFVNLVALAGIVAASVLTAPIGVKLAHSLPVDKLKRVFCRTALRGGHKDADFCVLVIAGFLTALIPWRPLQPSPGNIKPDGSYQPADKRRFFWGWFCNACPAGQAPFRSSCQDI